MKHLFLLFGMAGCAAQPATQAEPIKAALTPERVASLTTPMIFVRVPDNSAAATMVPVGQNGTIRSWRGQDGVQLSFDGGVLVATRGLGHDLMAADASPVKTAIATKGGTYARRIGRLDGNFKMVFGAWQCDLRQLATDNKTQRFEERCLTSDGPITNQYDLGPDRQIMQSRQWVSSAIGFLEIEIIRR